MVGRRYIFCGNCNPDVHPDMLREGLRLLAEKTDEEKTIVVHGCTRSCLLKRGRYDKGDGNIVVVYGRDLGRKRNEGLDEGI